jgi:formylglycine-generating enzyme required for sulfatase activity
VAIITSLRGIDEAISSLNYRNERALKYRLVRTIRAFYKDQSAVESIRGIETDELVKALWDTGNDPAIIKNKRKNLSIVRSSVNVDLRRLYKDGKNPEGITIGPTNIFVLSDEAKEMLLTAFTSNFAAGEKGKGTVTLAQIAQELDSLSQILSNPGAVADADSADGLSRLQELRKIIEGLSRNLGPGEKEGGLIDESGAGVETGGVEKSEGDGEKQEGLDVVEPGAEGVAGEDEPGGVEGVTPEGPEEIEEVDEDEVVEAEAVEDLVEAGADLEEVEIMDYPGEAGLSAGDPESGYLDGGDQKDDETEKARLLARQFDTYLGDRDRFYNRSVLIPGGEYTVGSKVPKDDEQPEHKVRLAPFYMGKFPVTNALFEIFVDKSGYITTAERLAHSTVYNGRFQDRVDKNTGSVKSTCHAAISCKTIRGACWYQPTGPGSTIHNKRNHPVVHVSLEDAIAFAAWTGRRLPTESEWESAARGVNAHAYPWGNDWMEDSCNIEENAVGDATPVDKYIEFASELGIVDAIGNVLEWTMDACKPPFHVKNVSTYRIVKGGSWISGNDIRLFSRFKWNDRLSSNILGFRCVAV